MKEGILKIIRQLQYEIDILDVHNKRLTGVNMRMQELRNLVNTVVVKSEGELLPCNHFNTEKWGNGIKCIDCGKSF